MPIIKCKMCGGDIQLAEDKTFGTCEYCGSTMTLPKVSGDQRAAAFNRGNHFRRMGEFDKALGVYERIVAEDDTDAEAHWCCALSRFGIEYVEDPATYEWLPTCHRASFDSFLEDVDYLAALDHSDGITRRQYQKDAAKIAEVQRGILATSQNTEPYDVFISYKELDADGNRTRDSILAQDIYYRLTEKGWRVFFSRISLEDVPGTQYEPYIFAALNSAKMMIVVGTSAENLNAVWVKNEWSRFLAMMRKDRSKLLIPCYRDMDPYDLPEQLSVLMSYDMGKIGFIQDLIRGVDKVLGTEKAAPTKETVVVQQGGGPNVTALLKRGQQALEDNNWDKAKSFYDQVLSMDAENAEAFLGLALADAKCANENTYISRSCAIRPEQEKKSLFPDRKRVDAAVQSHAVPGFLNEDEIRDLFRFDLVYYSDVKGTEKIAEQEKTAFRSNRNLTRALRFAKDETKARMDLFQSTLFSRLDDNVEKAKQREAAVKDEKAKAYEAHLTAAEQKIVELHRQAETNREAAYQSACKKQAAAKSIAEYLDAIGTFLEVEGYRDSDERTAQCRAAIEDIKEQDRQRKEAEAKAAAEEAERKRKAEAEEAERRRKAEAEEAERQRILKEKAEKERKAKNKKIGIVAGILAAVAAIAILIVTKVVIPNNRYKAAEALLKAGQYEEAIVAFEALGDYKDSELMVGESIYQKASEAFEKEQYTEAIELFVNLGDYKDSAEFLKKAETMLQSQQDEETYQKVLTDINTRRYDGIEGKLKELGDYKDSKEILKELSEYNAAIDAMSMEGFYLGMEGFLPSLKVIENGGTYISFPDEMEKFVKFFGSFVGTWTYSSGDDRLLSYTGKDDSKYTSIPNIEIKYTKKHGSGESTIQLFVDGNGKYASLPTVDYELGTISETSYVGGDFVFSIVDKNTLQVDFEGKDGMPAHAVVQYRRNPSWEELLQE